MRPFLALRSLLFPAILSLPSTEFLLRQEAVTCLHSSSALSNLLSQFSMGFVFKSSILSHVSAFTGRMEHPHQAPKKPAKSGQGCSGSCPAGDGGSRNLPHSHPGLSSQLRVHSPTAAIVVNRCKLKRLAVSIPAQK